MRLEGQRSGESEGIEAACKLIRLWWSARLGVTLLRKYFLPVARLSRETPRGRYAPSPLSRLLRRSSIGRKPRLHFLSFERWDPSCDWALPDNNLPERERGEDDGKDVHLCLSSCYYLAVCLILDMKVAINQPVNISDYNHPQRKREEEAYTLFTLLCSTRSGFKLTAAMVVFLACRLLVMRCW